MTHGANAVSQLHGHTANATWQGISPHEILGLTNGVHTPTWLGQPIRDTLERFTNADLDAMDDQPAARRFWDRIGKVPADELWEAHQRQKLELAIFARGRLRNQFARHGEAPATLEELEQRPRPEDPDDRVRPPVRDLQASRRCCSPTSTGWPACCGTRSGRSRSSSPARPTPPTGPARASSRTSSAARAAPSSAAACSSSRTTTSASRGSSSRASTCGSTTRAGRSRRRGRRA